MRMLPTSRLFTLPFAKKAIRHAFLGLCATVAIGLAPRSALAQQYTIAEIDSIHDLRFDAWGDDFEAVMLTQLETIKSSEQLGYKRGIARGYQLTATAMLAIGKYEEALRYADLAQRQRYTATDNLLQARIHNVYGRGYVALGFYQEAFDHLEKAIKALDGDPQHAEITSNIYYNKATIHRQLNNLESEFETLQELLSIYPLPTGHCRMAISYLDYKHNPDSALYHLHEASRLVEGHDSTVPLIDAIVAQSYGYYYEYQHAYDSALYHYQKALDLAYQTNMPERVRLAYESLADTYELAGDKENAWAFRTKYMHIDDSLKRAEKRALSVPVEQFLREKEQEHAQERLKMYLIFGSLLLLAIGGIFWLRYTYLKKKAEREELLETQAGIIKQQESETKALEQKVNTAFDEVLQLAKDNNPAFLARFQEVYPDFISKLTEANPKLANTELALCALIYLNLSSKDIARYTFIQPKSVQIRKYRLRKKLEIPQDTDLHVWMKSLA